MKNAGIKQQTTLIVAMCLMVLTGMVQAQNMFLMKSGVVVLKQSLAAAAVDSIVYYEPAHKVTTAEASSITATTATCGGTIAAYDGAIVTARGVCWSTTTMPTIALSTKISNGTGTGAFSSSLTGLEGSTKYYVRAYATNNSGVTSYGAEVSFVTLTTDFDGNVYTSVTIGTQTWMVENLKTTKYRNGDAIDNVTDNTVWLARTAGAWCDYFNIASNGTKYGHLYNWYAVSDTRNIAPVGWHVANDADWTKLESYVADHLGTSLNAAKALATATTDWTASSTAGTVGNNLALNNFTGFSALPGGYRYNDGTFYNQGYFGFWWSSTEYYTSSAWYRNMFYGGSNVYRNSSSKASGFSVRCVRD